MDISSMVALFLAGANVMIFCIVKFNDLAHLQKAQEDIKVALSNIDKKLDMKSERLAKLEGKCLANHG